MFKESDLPIADELKAVLEALNSRYKEGFAKGKAANFASDTNKKMAREKKKELRSIAELKKEELEEAILAGFPIELISTNIAQAALCFRDYFLIRKSEIMSGMSASAIRKITLRSLAKRAHKFRVQSEKEAKSQFLSVGTNDYIRAMERFNYWSRLEAVVKEATRLGWVSG